MSAWRKKAIEILPGHKKELEEPGTSVYGVFAIMLGELIRAHEENNTGCLKKIYAFAEWCFTQKASDLWNAAGVSFYEHLADERITYEAMPHWVKPAIYKEIKPLLERRLNEEDMLQLDRQYKTK